MAAEIGHGAWFRIEVGKGCRRVVDGLATETGHGAWPRTELGKRCRRVVDSLDAEAGGDCVRVVFEKGGGEVVDGLGVDARSRVADEGWPPEEADPYSRAGFEDRMVDEAPLVFGLQKDGKSCGRS